VIVRDIDELINALQAVKEKSANLPLNPFVSLDIITIRQKNGTNKVYLHFDKTFKNENEELENAFTNF